MLILFLLGGKKGSYKTTVFLYRKGVTDNYHYLIIIRKCSTFQDVNLTNLVTHLDLKNLKEPNIHFIYYFESGTI